MPFPARCGRRTARGRFAGRGFDPERPVPDLDAADLLHVGAPDLSISAPSTDAYWLCRPVTSEEGQLPAGILLIYPQPLLRGEVALLWADRSRCRRQGSGPRKRHLPPRSASSSRVVQAAATGDLDRPVHRQADPATGEVPARPGVRLPGLGIRQDAAWERRLDPERQSRLRCRTLRTGAAARLLGIAL
jgi:hypothetical protein